MTVAVVTLVAGRCDHLVRLLDGLAGQGRPPDEVLVVDLAPDDPAVRRCVEGRRATRRIPWSGGKPGPLPLAAGRNLGASASRCDDLVFLDVDCIPAPDLVASYEDALRRRPRSLACGPVRYLRAGWLADGPPDLLDIAALDARSDPPSARPRPAAIVDGDEHELFWSLSFGVTASTWSVIGGFDDAYVGYGGEDTDFALRARERGIGLAWLPGGVAYHQWHPPSRFDRARLRELVANARRFRSRWGWWPMGGWLDELETAGAISFDPAGDRLEIRG